VQLNEGLIYTAEYVLQTEHAQLITIDWLWSTEKVKRNEVKEVGKDRILFSLLHCRPGHGPNWNERGHGWIRKCPAGACPCHPTGTCSAWAD